MSPEHKKTLPDSSYSRVAGLAHITDGNADKYNEQNKSAENPICHTEIEHG
jgi:hypothetical protein